MSQADERGMNSVFRTGRFQRGRPVSDGVAAPAVAVKCTGSRLAALGPVGLQRADN
jgi:hypothetical protein